MAAAKRYGTVRMLVCMTRHNTARHGKAKGKARHDSRAWQRWQKLTAVCYVVCESFLLLPAICGTRAAFFFFTWLFFFVIFLLRTFWRFCCRCRCCCCWCCWCCCNCDSCYCCCVSFFIWLLRYFLCRLPFCVCASECVCVCVWCVCLLVCLPIDLNVTQMIW